MSGAVFSERLTGLASILAAAEQDCIPLSAQLELTQRCNLDCKHCYLDLRNPAPEMSTAEWIATVDQLADAGTFFLTITGGEIFLRRDTLEIARHARRRGLALRLFTNATRIDRALAREIAELRPMAVEVSLYGAHQGPHHELTRRRWAFRRTLRGVLLLRKHGVTVGLKTPLMSDSLDELDSLVRLADRAGCRIAVDPTVNARRDGNLAPTTLRADSERLARALQHPRLGLLPGKQLPGPRDPNAIPCALGRRTLRVAPNGDVFPCPTYPQAIGNVRERSLRELWAGGPLLERLRAVRIRDLHGDCHGCSQSGYCTRCTAMALVENGDELGPYRESCRVAEAKEIALDAPRHAPKGRPRFRLPIAS
jgi:radical SAM protein with 4Fe4S-binding SPASM domain